LESGAESGGGDAGGDGRHGSCAVKGPCGPVWLLWIASGLLRGRAAAGSAACAIAPCDHSCGASAVNVADACGCSLCASEDSDPARCGDCSSVGSFAALGGRCGPWALPARLVRLLGHGRALPCLRCELVSLCTDASSATGAPLPPTLRGRTLCCRLAGGCVGAPAQQDGAYATAVSKGTSACSDSS
jgi:hypothetical protein